ncbi:uncharacterized protein C1orf198 homolog [Amia ocellicauda]|uniref:uncharacterized protein C1orf198 homolog n=1 Tax=Amia ocellicauda TaxID=2972642 RepID=UPI0034646669
MAAVTLAGGDAHRMEAKKFEYFSSINSMAKKIMLERESIKQKHGPQWEKMTPNEQDSAIDNCLMDPQIRARYAMHRVDREELIFYPKYILQTGQKTVHFGEEDITWQDEHSSPFSWETRSQMEFSLTSSPVASEQGSSSSQADSKPAAKLSQPSKSSQSSQATKVAQSSKAPNGDGPGLGRKEEESSFWKISAERSRLEGEQADFQSLTPSQIKSLEKGEKPLPSYLRQESAPREKEEQRTERPRAPRPEKPPPIKVASPAVGLARAKPSLSSVSSVDEVFTPGPETKSPAHIPSNMKAKEKDEPPMASSPTFSQFNTSNSILKTGFDFLDNW